MLVDTLIVQQILDLRHQLLENIFFWDTYTFTRQGRWRQEYIKMDPYIKDFSGPLGTGENDNPNGGYYMDIVDLSVNDFI